MQTRFDSVKAATALRALSTYGIACCLVAAGLIVLNQYTRLASLDTHYRIDTPALCFFLSFVIAAVNIRTAIAACVFLLPLLPTLGWQIQQYFGYGRILDVHSAGLDLAGGLLLGSMINKLRHKQTALSAEVLPWPAGLLMAVLTLSVFAAISRNLHQSESLFSVKALVFNLLHLRTLTWHDDYRPLLDWISYGCATAILAVLIPTLKSAPDRNDLIFKPLMASLLLSAIVGWRQSSFGMGLSLDQRNFRVDQFGFMALGFQPDIHAFAGVMLIGAVGLFGYLYTKRQTWFRLVPAWVVVLCCWIALFLSKSKASFSLAVVLSVGMGTVWFLRKRIRPTKLLIGIVVCIFVCFVFALIAPSTLIDFLTSVGKPFGINSQEDLNLKLSYRPEVYLAAAHMFYLFPFFGLGQGEFYRQSANYDLTNSFFLSIQQNGEHAHNYFLQVLVENGIIGFTLFVVLLAYPIFKVPNKRTLTAAFIALIALLAGNIFSHSLLVRENLLLAACLIALIYSWVPISSFGTGGQLFGAGQSPAKTTLLILVLLSLSGALYLYENFNARSATPFNIDTQCFKPRKLEKDGWTSGQYELTIPRGSSGLTIQLATTQPDVTQRPLTGSIKVLADQKVLTTERRSLNTTGPQQLKISLPAGTLATPSDYQVELTLSRCFIPRNFGMNEDSRRLGVRIEAIHWH